MPITLRTTKGTALTYTELDDNFIFLSSSISSSQITNNSAGNIVTANGAVGAIGQSNLTFDGTTLTVTGSLKVSGSTFLSNLVTSSATVPNVVMYGANGQLFITASSAIGGGGTGGTGTPGGSNTQIQYNNIGAFAGVPTLTYNGTTLSATGSFSGSLTGTATTASFLLNNIDLSGSLRLYVSPGGDDINNDGTQPTKPFKTIKAAVESIGAINPLIPKRYTIYVSTGNYQENNPIIVPPGTAIVGDNLRTVRLTAANPRKDYFHCHDSNYFYGLRFIDMQYPSFAFSFPCSIATGSVSSSGQIQTPLSIVHSATGYPTSQTNLDIGIIIEAPDSISGSATPARAVVNTDSNGAIIAINLTNSGSLYAVGEKFHVSIPAPVGQQPYIFASPYVQNCSSITGPFTVSGIKIPATDKLPWTITSVSGSSVDHQGAGGGIRIDGNLVNIDSGLQSFVADAFTQVNQGGPGHLVINNGYAQFVSCFTTFCTYGFKVAAGGFGNISNSVCDFGDFGLISKKNFPIAYNTASVVTGKTSTVTSLKLITGGNGYSSSAANTASLSITGGGGSNATGYAKVVSGSLTELILTATGSGYTTIPRLIIQGANSGSIQTTATGSVNLSGVSQFLMRLLTGSRGVDISSNMFYSGSNYIVTGVTSGSNANERTITVFPAPPSIVAPNTASFTQLSNISTGGLVMEYVGSGVTYNSLPKFGGVPSSGAEVTEIAPGKVFYATVDNVGNFKVGPYFGVNQLTGDVTISSDNFSLAGISSIGPFKRNGIVAGVVLNEVSNVTSLVNSQGVVGQDTVPTQYAVQQYIINQGLSSGNTTGNAATATTATSVSNVSSAIATGNTQYYVLTASGSGKLVGNPNLYFDGTNLGIGKTNPTVPLDVLGDVAISGVLRDTTTVNTQVASYTLVITDRGKLIEMDSGSANTVTIPSSSAVNFPIGSRIDIVQRGNGATSITTGSAVVNLNSYMGYAKLAGAFAAATIVKSGTDDWYLFGNLKL